MPSDTFHPRAMQTVLVGGAIAGLLDGLDAVIFYWLAYAVPARGALSRRRQRTARSTIVSRRLAYGRLRRRPSVFHRDRLRNVLLRGVSFDPGAVAQTLDQRTCIRNRPVLLHATCGDTALSRTPAHRSDVLTRTHRSVALARIPRRPPHRPDGSTVGPQFLGTSSLNNSAFSPGHAVITFRR